MELRKFFRKFLLLMPVIGLVVGLNFKVDPANLFQDSYERGIADLLLEGKNIANIDNYDDRLVQKLYIDGMSSKKDIVIFGSSHAMSIHASLFGDKTVFNHSVSGASLEDHIAIAEIYHQRDLLPTTVIISLDPWLLNRNNGQVKWISLEGDYQAAAKRLGLPSSLALPERLSLRTKKYLELISPSYFQESVRFWSIGLKDPGLIPGNYHATEETVGDVAIRLSDGSLSRDKEERARISKGSYLNAIGTLQKFDRLDPDLKMAFEVWVSSLKKEDVEVVFLLTPYHPRTYSYLRHSAEYGIILEVQSYYKAIARQKGILLLGSFNPVHIPCSVDEFYDEQHPKESCLERILSNEFGSD